MRQRLRSAARPSPIRVLGFLALATGAVLVGVGATREWASVGFVGDVERAADVSVHGTDVWEGQVLLLAAASALFALIAMRLAGTPAVRRAIAIGLVGLGIAAAAIALSTAMRPEARFGGVEGVDRLAAHIARELGQPEDVVRKQLREQFAAQLRVDVGSGTWLAAAGGAALAAGGLLSVVWARRGDGASPTPREVDAAATGHDPGRT